MKGRKRENTEDQGVIVKNIDMIKKMISIKESLKIKRDHLLVHLRAHLLSLLSKRRTSLKKEEK
jgi:hypothetical protein